MYPARFSFSIYDHQMNLTEPENAAHSLAGQAQAAAAEREYERAAGLFSEAEATSGLEAAQEIPQ